MNKKKMFATTSVVYLIKNKRIKDCGTVGRLEVFYGERDRKNIDVGFCGAKREKCMRAIVSTEYKKDQTENIARERERR